MPAKSKPLPFVRRFTALALLLSSPVFANHTPRDLMELTLEELMDIEVFSVSRRQEKLSHSASSIQVITADQIRRSGATSIPEALRLASNLQVAQQNSYEWVVTARGFSSDVGNKLLVLIDGRTVYTPLFSGVFWDRQNYLLEDIERIEVISGPGGTLWGANAVNGVINIITRSSAQTQGTYLEAAAGSALNQQAGARYGGHLNESTTYRVYGQHFDRDEESLSNGSPGSDDWTMKQAGFRVDSALPADTFTVQGDYYRLRGSQLLADDRETYGGNMLGRWSHRISDTANTILQVYYDRTELKMPVATMLINGIPLAPPGVFRDLLDIMDLDFQHQFLLSDRHKIVWGFGYRYTRDDVTNTGGLAFYPDFLEQELFSAFLQDEIALVQDKVYFTVGTKVEKNDFTGTEWEPGIRLQWRLSEHHQIWSAVSRAVRMPSRIDRHISLPSRDALLVVLQGGPDFESETVDAYELGYRGRISNKAALSVALFYNEYDNVRSTSPTPVTLAPFFFENNLEGETQGVELSLDMEIAKWWRIRMGYNYLHEDISVQSGEFDLNNARNETADPEHQFMLRASFDISHDVELDVGYRWVDRLPTNDVDELVYVPKYDELDVRIGWTPTANLELALVGQNLLHDHHQEFGQPGDQQQEVGRNIYAKVQLRY